MGDFSGITNLISTIAFVINIIGLGLILLAIWKVVTSPSITAKVISAIYIGTLIALSISAYMSGQHIKDWQSTIEIQATAETLDEPRSLYLPQLNLDSIPYGLFDFVDPIGVAAEMGPVFLETGSNPIYRWELLLSSEKCLDSSLFILPIAPKFKGGNNHNYSAFRSVALGNCFQLTVVDNSEAELRLEISELIDPIKGVRSARVATLTEQSTNKILDVSIDFTGKRPRMAFLLGQYWMDRTQVEVRKVRFDDHESGALIDLRNLTDENPQWLREKEIEFAQLDRNDQRAINSYSRNPYSSLSHFVGTTFPLDQSLIQQAIDSVDHRIVFGSVFLACGHWNDLSHDLREQVRSILADIPEENRSRMRDPLRRCGVDQCRSPDRNGVYRNAECIDPREPSI